MTNVEIFQLAASLFFYIQKINRTNWKCFPLVFNGSYKIIDMGEKIIFILTGSGHPILSE